MSKHTSTGAAWRALRIQVLERDNWTCMHCGIHPLVGNDATADHLIPKAKGGLDEAWNLVSSCRKCNGRKSDHDLTRNSGQNPRWFG